MSVASVLASVTPDKELADRLLAALSSNGISNLRLLESITTSTPIFSAVLNTFAEDESFKDKKGLAGVTLSASAREAGAQLQFALSSAMSSSGRRNPGGQSRLDFSEAIARVKSRYGKIAFMPSAKALEILAKGGLHTYIDFNSMNVSDKGAKKMALTDDGVAVFIQSPDEPSDGSDKGRPKALWSSAFLRAFFSWAFAVLIVQEARSSPEQASGSGNSASAGNEGGPTPPQAPAGGSAHVELWHFLSYLSRVLEVAGSHRWDAAIRCDAVFRRKLEQRVRGNELSFEQGLVDEAFSTTVFLNALTELQMEHLRKVLSSPSKVPPGGKGQKRSYPRSAGPSGSDQKGDKAEPPSKFSRPQSQPGRRQSPLTPSPVSSGAASQSQKNAN